MRGPERRWTKAQVKAALVETGGMIKETFDRLGMSPHTFYSKYRYDPEIEALITALRQQGFEAVTDVLFEQAKAGNLKAIRIYLQFNPLAKQNNWVEKSEVVVRDEKPLTDEEREELKKELFG